MTVYAELRLEKEEVETAVREYVERRGFEVVSFRVHIERGGHGTDKVVASGQINPYKLPEPEGETE